MVRVVSAGRAGKVCGFCQGLFPKVCTAQEGVTVVSPTDSAGTSISLFHVTSFPQDGCEPARVSGLASLPRNREMDFRADRTAAEPDGFRVLCRAKDARPPRRSNPFHIHLLGA